MTRSLALAFALLTMAVLAITAAAVYAHEAALGWTYDPKCCAGRDCRQIAATAVSAQEDGWHVHVEPGEHPSLAKAADFIVPYDKTKPSGDSEFHLCIHQRTGTVMCLYIPNMGT